MQSSQPLQKRLQMRQLTLFTFNRGKGAIKHAGIGLNHLNRISNLKHAFFNKKSFYIKVSWHVQELSDQSIKSELYAIIGRAIFRVLIWNVHEKPEHAAFQLSTCCSFFNILKRKWTFGWTQILSWKTGSGSWVKTGLKNVQNVVFRICVPYWIVRGIVHLN